MKRYKGGFPDGLWLDTKHKILWSITGNKATVVMSKSTTSVGRVVSNKYWDQSIRWVNLTIKYYYEKV
jgi:hypothetical protein